MRQLIDMAGRKIGMINVVSYAGPVSLWNIRCDCGNEKIMRGGSIRQSKSCGCIKKSQLGLRSFKHGDAERGNVAPELSCWRGFIRRCTDPKDDSFSYYGGRGISVCERWLNSYPAFLENMGRKPSPKHSLDRIDNDGNYEPGNCRWATKTQQMRNRRGRRVITFFGRPMPASEAAEMVGLKYDAFLLRLDRGWTEERALLTPLLPTFGGIGAERFSHTDEAASLKRVSAVIHGFFDLSEKEKEVFMTAIRQQPEERQ
jgi:hypothetical protein